MDLLTVAAYVAGFGAAVVADAIAIVEIIEQWKAGR